MVRTDLRPALVSWWAVPLSRAQFDRQAAAELQRMTASQEGFRLPIWTSKVGPKVDPKREGG